MRGASKEKVAAHQESGEQASDGRLRVGMLGLGTVGGGVAEILSRHRELIRNRTGISLDLVRAFVRRPSRERQGAAADVELTTKPERVVLAPDVDIVVELLGGMEPARSLIMQALQAGKPVITANKAVLATHGAQIFKEAALHNTDVYFEAAVAGGIPIIRTLREGLASDRITQVRGILNGTTNFMLGRLAKGESYAKALAEAQRLGYAEADPTLDVNGRDATDKLTILLQLAFGTRALPDEIPTEGITELGPEVLADAKELGYVVKLLAVAKRVTQGDRERLDARVYPALVPSEDVLSTVPANQNAIAVESDSLGSTLYQGPGAGGMPTGSAVVADLIDAARNLRAGAHGRVALMRAKSAPKLIRPAESVSAYYVRLLVEEKPGVMAAVASVFGKQKISLATIMQRQRAGEDGVVPLTLTTHQAPWGAMQRAMHALERLNVLRGPACVLRVEP